MSTAKPLPNDSINPEDTFVNSRRVYAEGRIHKDLRVPFRRIDLADTALADGEQATERVDSCVRHARAIGRSGYPLRCP